MIKKVEIGEIIWVRFQGENHIQNGARPAVVIQNNKGNHFSPTVQVIPLTSKLNKAKLPTHAIIKSNKFTGLKQTSIAQCEGARVISKVDILAKIGRVDKETMKAVARCWLINNPLVVFFTDDELINLYDELRLINEAS